MSSFDTSVEGSPESVRSAATWLRDSLGAALGSGGDDVAAARSASGFDGQAGEAYRSYTATIVGHLDDSSDDVDRAAGLLDSYATRLGEHRRTLAGIRDSARQAELTVVGTVVLEPPAAAAVAALPAGATQEQQTQYDRDMAAHAEAAAKITAYDDLASRASTERESFADWIQTNLVARTSEFTNVLLDRFWGYLQENAGNLLLATGLEKGTDLLEKRAKGLADEAEDLRSARRSGNPARRALGLDPETPGRISDLLEESRWLGRGGKLLGPVGTAYDSYQALESDEPAGGLVAAGVGMAATAGTIAYIAGAPVTVPATVAIVAGVAVGAGASWLVSEGWDALPDGFTDAADDAVKDVWDGAKDLASGGVDMVKGWF
ncbi:hypothetical protein [Nocardioides sp.]|uniref:hypothetical protein n=1 Tax=Nocardioides sp. TaxID=35761 RepID=UPI0035189D3C